MIMCIYDYFMMKAKTVDYNKKQTNHPNLQRIMKLLDQ